MRAAEWFVNLHVLSWPHTPLPADGIRALLWREADRQLDEQLRNWQPLGISPAIGAVEQWERDHRGREWWYAQRAELARRRAPARKRTGR